MGASVATHGTAAGDTRRVAMEDYGVLEAEAQPIFERITRIASTALGMPITHVSFLDGEQQWIQAAVGLNTGPIPLKDTFCLHALEQDDLLEIADATEDGRFVQNPYVTGMPYIRFYAGAPLVTRDRVPFGTLCAIDSKPRVLSPAERQMMADLAALVMHQLELSRAALADSLTGSWNRRMLSRVFAAESMRSARSAETFAFAVIDLDHFKKLNDTHGHAAGDAVLVAFAETIRRILRPVDWLFRLGGEEFGLILAQCGAEQGARIVDRIREVVAADPAFAGVAPVTFSAGVSSSRDLSNGSGDRLEQVMQRADKALYAAKEGGRNRVVTSGLS
ncbi:GGDEF domain-containing protein [Amorphus orientalis]|uniref:diguanylate cyclase n=1 Tax=Amorphus orientalis TaxID=649198 RepID=A0AAE3VNH6_9HYPH|nr:sensor domain-containing diguanylate cyclase [Amorphus orientalis]MDQ0315202.1 diguanylate cyclase (GGDEF)-like protein [Amorphus orientalis]